MLMKILFNCLSIFLLFLNCPVQSQPADIIPEHQSFIIDSKELKEQRVINVWLPEDYDSSETKYPVLYMPDGGIQEDFPHIANTLSELIQNKKIPPFILVGIENTERRRDLSPPTKVEKDKEIAPVVGGSAVFRAFVQNELIPEINAKYRTTNEKGIIGESLAGLFIVETLMIQPDLFDYYIAMDPSLWWNDHNLVKTAKEKLTKFPTETKRFWFAGSKTKDINKFTNSLFQTLKSDAPKSLIWSYSDEPKEKHSTIYRATKEKAIIWTLNK